MHRCFTVALLKEKYRRIRRLLAACSPSRSHYHTDDFIAAIILAHHTGSNMGKASERVCFSMFVPLSHIQHHRHHSQNYTFARIWKIIVFVIFHEMLSGLPYTLIWDL